MADPHPILSNPYESSERSLVIVFVLGQRLRSTTTCGVEEGPQRRKYTECCVQPKEWCDDAALLARQEKVLHCPQSENKEVAHGETETCDRAEVVRLEGREANVEEGGAKPDHECFLKV